MQMKDPGRQAIQSIITLNETSDFNSIIKALGQLRTSRIEVDENDFNGCVNALATFLGKAGSEPPQQDICFAEEGVTIARQDNDDYIRINLKKNWIVIYQNRSQQAWNY